LGVVVGDDPGEDGVVGGVEVAPACVLVDQHEVLEVAEFVVAPEGAQFLQHVEGLEVEFFGVEGYLVEFHEGDLIGFVLSGEDHVHELVLVLVDEVEDEAGAVFELDQQALPSCEVPAFDDVADLYNWPVFLYGFVLREYEGGELQV
jgi:hypothetical protein